MVLAEMFSLKGGRLVYSWMGRVMICALAFFPSGGFWQSSLIIELMGKLDRRRMEYQIALSSNNFLLVRYLS
jgi:hypothetical protein